MKVTREMRFRLGVTLDAAAELRAAYQAMEDLQNGWEGHPAEPLNRERMVHRRERELLALALDLEKFSRERGLR